MSRLIRDLSWLSRMSFCIQWPFRVSSAREILDGQDSGLFSNEPFEKRSVMTIEDVVLHSMTISSLVFQDSGLFSNRPFEKRPVMTIEMHFESRLLLLCISRYKFKFSSQVSFQTARLKRDLNLGHRGFRVSSARERAVAPWWMCTANSRIKSICGGYGQ